MPMELIMPDESIERAARQKPLEAISAALAARGEGGDDAGRFARRLFGSLAASDLQASAASHLATASLALMTLARRRLPGVAKIHVFNPKSGDVGWSTARTIVQLVNDDMSFLVDSVTAELARRDLQVHLIAHPVLSVRRDSFGAALSLGYDDNGPRESLMHIEIDRQDDTAALDDLAGSLARLLQEVREAVEDWQKMRAACLVAGGELPAAGGAAAAPDCDEARAFLHWIEAQHFTFLGYRRYRHTAQGGYDLVAGSGLGILRRADERLFDARGGSRGIFDEIARRASCLTLLKTDRESLVHRSGPMDCIIVKAFDRDGRVVGEHRFVGLFTSLAYQVTPGEIPILRRKVAAVMQRAGLEADSHDGKALSTILHNWPRDELLQIDEDALYDAALGVLQLQERHRVALFERRDMLGRFVSCLIFVPRDRWDSAMRRRFLDILTSAYGGTLASYSASVGDASMLARILFVLRRGETAVYPDAVAVEASLVDAATSWIDRLKAALATGHDAAAGAAARRRWIEAFPTGYREAYSAADAVTDLAHVEAVAAGHPLGIDLQRRPDQPPHRLSLKLFHAGEPIPLSDILPPLENMGLRVLTEAPFRLRGDGEKIVWLHDFLLETANGAAVDAAAVERSFEAALGQVWCGGMESDGLNRLVLSVAMSWRDIVVLRLYARYLRQTGLPFGQDYMETAITGNPEIAVRLLQLFHARLDPGLGTSDSALRKSRIASIESALDPALDSVASLDQDRILRRFRNAIDCTLRSNFYQRQADGREKPWLSVKLDSRNLLELPSPRPMTEIFVYSPRVEGVHLRGGRVARGGIRWSDRREDFRTEVLGLMKAQMVKNAVIVPVGVQGRLPS